MTDLVLASSSRYKRDLLARLKLPFETAAPEVDETARPFERPGDLAPRLARLKAENVAGPGIVTIGADQAASLDGHLLGKPLAHAAALAQLEACQGRVVTFHTAAFVLDTDRGRHWQHVDVTEVKFRRRRRADLDRYLTLEPAYDCAGGFKAEGLGVALLETVESRDPTALIGLPLIWLAEALREAGFDGLGS